jgi:transcriptional regulator with XRE-family HTH domain
LFLGLFVGIFYSHEFKEWEGVLVKKESVDTGKFKKLGKYIREKRTDHKLTQKGLAKKAGLDWQEISRIERGERKRSSMTTVLKILEVLGDPVDALVRSGFIPALSSEERKLISDPSFSKVFFELSKVSDLNEKDKQKLTEVIIRVIQVYK